jgi:hypothetical protein
MSLCTNSPVWKNSHFQTKVHQNARIIYETMGFVCGWEGGGHYKPHNLLAECDAKSYEFFITYLEHRDRGLTIVKVGNGKKKTCFLLDSWLESKLYLTYGNVSGANAPCGATMQTPTHAPWILIQQSSELG